MLLAKFQECLATSPGAFVNIEPLQEMCNLATPLSPRASLAESTLIGILPDVILRNICQRKDQLLKKTAVSLIHVLEEKEEHQLYLALHASKALVDPAKLRLVFSSIPTVKLRETGYLAIGFEVGNWIKKVLVHGQILEEIRTIVKSITRRQELKTSPPLLQIEFIATDGNTFASDIKGWVGKERIYVNIGWFDTRGDALEATIPKAKIQLLLRLGLASLAMHEYTHLWIRHELDNMNASTPILVQGQECPSGQPPEGCWIESRIWNRPREWMESIDADDEYMKNFVKAIKKNSPLPTFTPEVDGCVVVAQPTLTMGLSYHQVLRFY